MRTKASWIAMREHLALFLEGANHDGDYIKAVRKNGKWRIETKSGDYKVIGEDEDFRVAFCKEN